MTKNITEVVTNDINHFNLSVFVSQYQDVLREVHNDMTVYTNETP